MIIWFPYIRHLYDIRVFGPAAPGRTIVRSAWFLLWGNNNPTYNQNTMGYTSNSDFSKIVYNSPQEAFNTPAEMGYMESHDEERLMYKNLQYGNSSGGYNVKHWPRHLIDKLQLQQFSLQCRS
jgi:hypothetical protein